MNICARSSFFGTFIPVAFAPNGAEVGVSSAYTAAVENVAIDTASFFVKGGDACRATGSDVALRFRELVKRAKDLDGHAIDELKQLADAGHETAKTVYANFSAEWVVRHYRSSKTCYKDGLLLDNLLPETHHDRHVFLHQGMVALVAAERSVCIAAIRHNKFHLIKEAAEIDTKPLEWLLKYRGELSRDAIRTHWLPFVRANVELFIPLIEQEIDSPSKWPIPFKYSNYSERATIVDELLRLAAKKSAKIDKFLRNPASHTMRLLGGGFHVLRALDQL